MRGLEVRNLAKVYETGFIVKRYIKAVNNVSFKIAPGEIVSLVGESGSGKTTIAKIVLRLLNPTAGEVLVDGVNIWAKENRRSEFAKKFGKKVHAIFQDPFASYNPFYPIERVLWQALELLGVDKTSNEAKEIMFDALKNVGLDPEVVFGKYPHQLSGGEKQRVMIARCWMLKPSLIIADEPVSMIDASSRGGVIKLFEKLKGERETSILFITHDMGLAYYISDRILIMHRGNIVEEGEPDEIVTNPKYWYTKNLISSIPTLYRKLEGIS